MKICALSDLHGYLPTNIQPCDIVTICGDIMPLDIQRSHYASTQWLTTQFADWAGSLPCSYGVFIAGNHDFLFTKMDIEVINDLIKTTAAGLAGKLIYLENSGVTLNGVRIYGSPWCEGPAGWAFVSEYINHYTGITDCDILLTHQPPKLGNVGVCMDFPYHPDFGSSMLLEEARKHHISHWFCGHIHSGEHRPTITHVKDDMECSVVNVSIKDEDYEPTYPPFYVEI